jgi:hypothetical protein
LSFDGLRVGDGGSYAYAPPDPNGDVGPNHYIQTVNFTIAIYDKSGVQLLRIPFNNFFDGTGTPCDTINSGDPVVVYDRLAGRWLITDFSTPIPYYECVAISHTSDPLTGGWDMYGIKISDTAMNDYPKIGVWPDAYYLSFNMFVAGSAWGGVEVWALNRDRMLNGQPLQSVHFSLSAESGYASLLPSHALTTPPSGSENYYVSFAPPNKLQLWKFHVDWNTPASSTFTGPSELAIADFAIAASVQQKGSSSLLDSVSFRPMMQLIYRKINDTESLWANHTVASSGIAAVRWYEVRDPGGTPTVFQQGTYQPDANHRWMGSLAVDRDGNMAVGYSVSSLALFPSIRYAGRLAGEVPGILTQAEASFIEGSGSQYTSNRWGDYSDMSVDPVDDCTFWYTNEYFTTTGSAWRTRIGSFKYPSCGTPKGFVDGYVRNAVTLAPISNVLVVAQSPTQTLSVITNASGYYTMTLPVAVYDLTAGPRLPGYPTTDTITNTLTVISSTVSHDFWLAPVPTLAGGPAIVNDAVDNGNGNGYPEPGEKALQLWRGLTNIGAITSTNVTAQLFSLTPGLTITTSQSAYPDIQAGKTLSNTGAYVFSVAPWIACGSDLSFRQIVVDNTTEYTLGLTLNASIPLTRTEVFANDVEGSQMGWTTGGVNNVWITTTSTYHSPTHSWSDGPGMYSNNTNAWLMSPAIDLRGKRHIQVEAWVKYSLEAGWDYVYVEYSLNGTSWNTLTSFTGVQSTWTQVTLDAPALDGQSAIHLRFRLVSDTLVTFDGFYVDDIVVSYEPYECLYGVRRLYLPVIRR